MTENDLIFRNDWGKEGVLRKLVSLWNSNIYPIAMKEIMQANNQRMSGATAFFSLMGKRVIFNASHQVNLIRILY